MGEWGGAVRGGTEDEVGGLGAPGHWGGMLFVLINIIIKALGRIF